MFDVAPPVRIQRNTGLRILKRKAEKIIAAYVSGMSLRGICRAFGTNWSAVTALIRNRGEMVEKARTEAREAWATLAALGTAELIARQKDMQTHSLIVSAGIATEKAALLEDTTEAPREEQPPPAVEAWQQYLEAAGAPS